MKNIKLLFRLILPVILCVLIIYITKMSISYYPISFGLVIGLTNWKMHKYNPYIGTLLSVIVSLISFWLAFSSMGVLSYLAEFIRENTTLAIGGDRTKIYYLIISVFIIAPILVFLSYRFVFNIPKTKFRLYVVISSISLLVLYSVFWNNSDVNDSNRMLPYTIWQIIMAFSLEALIINGSLITDKK